MEKWNVLLVDDEEDFVTTLAERLALRGARTRTAFNGDQALRAIASDPPQIVVLDLMMPGMSGLEVLRRIKADFPHLPVILLTGIGSTKDGMDGLRLGAFDYLMKPLQIDELTQKISEALKQASSGSE
jgi:two-component system, OmpR family, response regulator